MSAVSYCDSGFCYLLGFCFVLFASSLASGVSPVHSMYCFCIWIDIFLFEDLNLPVACIIKSKLFSLMLAFFCSLGLPYLTRFLLSHCTLSWLFLLQPGLNRFFSGEHVYTPLSPSSSSLPQIVWPTTFALRPSLNF